MMQTYVSWLSRQPGARVLDIGPVCDVTINTLLPHVKKLYLYDMFLRLGRGVEIRSLADNFIHLHAFFYGIQVWDLVDHCSNDEVSALADTCHALLKPGGALLVTSYDEGVAHDPCNAFAVFEDFQVTLKPQRHLNLRYTHRQNQKLIDAMKQFTLFNSYKYQCGVREFYFRKR